MINITTSFFPYRLDIKSKEPVELSITIKNMSKKTELISYDVILENTLSFDKSGLKKSNSHRVGELKPDEKRTFKFDVYPFQGITPGNNRIKIIVNQHYQNYDHLTDKTEKITVLKSFK